MFTQLTIAVCSLAKCVRCCLYLNAFKLWKIHTHVMCMWLMWLLEGDLKIILLGPCKSLAGTLLKTKLQLWHEILDSRDFRVILYCIAKRESQFQAIPCEWELDSYADEKLFFKSKRPPAEPGTGSSRHILSLASMRRDGKEEQ